MRGFDRAVSKPITSAANDSGVSFTAEVRVGVVKCGFANGRRKTRGSPPGVQYRGLTWNGSVYRPVADHTNGQVTVPKWPN